MTKREWVENEIGWEILCGMPDEVFDFYYKAMHDYDVGFYDAERYAWLNTLFGYDIGAEHALGIITWFDDNNGDVFDLTEKHRLVLLEVCNQLGYHLDFGAWAKEEPKAIAYEWGRNGN